MILVNGLHWDHIAQSSTTSSSSLPGEGITAEQEQDWEESGLVQLILFGLEQGKDYEIELSCSSTAQSQSTLAK